MRNYDQASVTQLAHDVTLCRGSLNVKKGDNEIIVERDGGGLSITFFTVRGIVDNWSGFIYRSDGHSPTEADIGGLILELIKLDDHWYWIATT